MLESDLIQSTSSWPFVEIRKLLKDRKEILNNKKKIITEVEGGRWPQARRSIEFLYSYISIFIYQIIHNLILET